MNTEEMNTENSKEESTESSTQASSAGSESAEDKKEESAESAQAESQEAEKEPVKIEFPYSELIRAKVPKAFEVVEKAATDWKNEGDFTDLGIGHPLAGIVASQALQKAKDVEKKLEEKGVISMAKMGLEIAKSQVETIKSKMKV